MAHEIHINQFQDLNLDASLYSCVFLTDDGGDQADNGRSIIGLWSTSAFSGKTLTIKIADTRDASEVSRAKNLLLNKFGSHLDCGNFD